MMTVDDALAIDAVLQCIYGVRRLICRGKSSQPPRRIRPQNHTLAAPRPRDGANACTRCIEGLLMMTVDDALAIDAVLQCIYGVLRLICRGKSSQPPIRIRPQYHTLAAPRPRDGANTCARCIEGLLLITVDDALAIDAVFQCIYGVHRLICRGIRHAASALQSFCFCSILVDSSFLPFCHAC